MRIAILAVLCSLTLCACGARNIKPGETPNANEGIAFVRVTLVLDYEPSKWSQKYEIRCNNSPDDATDAYKMYGSTYGPLTQDMPNKAAADGLR